MFKQLTITLYFRNQ